MYCTVGTYHRLFGPYWVEGRITKQLVNITGLLQHPSNRGQKIHVHCSFVCSFTP